MTRAERETHFLTWFHAVRKCLADGNGLSNPQQSASAFSVPQQLIQVCEHELDDIKIYLKFEFNELTGRQKCQMI